jgi:hypothetical protein
VAPRLLRAPPRARRAGRGGGCARERGRRARRRAARAPARPPAAPRSAPRGPRSAASPRSRARCPTRSPRSACGENDSISASDRKPVRFNPRGCYQLKGQGCAGAPEGLDNGEALERRVRVLPEPRLMQRDVQRQLAGRARKPLGVPLDRIFELPRRGVLRRWTPVMDGERCAPGLYVRGEGEVCLR